MIAELAGRVTQKGEGSLVLAVAGVGFQVFVVHETIESVRLNAETHLFTYLAVREDALELYGFLDEASRTFFELLLSVSGVGPKTALAILNIAPVETLESAIASGDPAHLSKATGIGAKRAERIVLELKDKVVIAEGDASVHKETSDVIEALTALGYSQKEARDVLQKLPKGNTTTEEKIKQALKLLGR